MGWHLTRFGKAATISSLIVMLSVCVLLYQCRSKPSTSYDSICEGFALQRPLRVGIVTWPGYIGGIVANHGLGPSRSSLFLKRHDVCVEFFVLESADDRLNALKKGKNGVDVVWSTIDQLPLFLTGDLKAKAILQVDWSHGGAIVADGNVQRIEDLYQKKIALASNTPSLWLLELYLQNSKLTVDKQAWIMNNLVKKDTSEDALGEFVDKKVDAAVVLEPDVTEAPNLRVGSHTLASAHEDKEQKLIADVIVMREDFMTRAHKSAIDGFVEGLIEDGTNRVKGQEDEAVRLMKSEARYRDLDSNTIRQILREVKFASLEDNVKLFNVDHLYSPQQGSESLFDKIYTEAAERWVKRGYIHSYRPPAEVKEVRYIRDMYESKFDQAERPIIVNFEVADDALTKAAKEIIDGNISALAKAISDNYYIEVEGNTDNSGDLKGNKALSWSRAKSVVDYLVNKHGLPYGQFRIIGNGSGKPVATNETPEGQARNRRVEIRVPKK